MRKNNIKVVSVGNLSVGGTGKTPFVHYLSSLLFELGIKHSVISRGYKRLSSKNLLVSDGEKILSTPELSGDEPYMLSSLLPNVPVFSGNKIESILKTKHDFGIDCCLVDDGFQSYYLNKNVDIVLVDVSLKISDFYLLPLGQLREPLGQLNRADVVVFTKTNLTTIKNFTLIKKLVLKHINTKQCLVLSSKYVSSVVFYGLNKVIKNVNKKITKQVVMVSGIGDPSSFKKTINPLFSSITKELVFSDHHKYSQKDIDYIEFCLLKFNSTAVVMTRKDFVKIKSLTKTLPMYVVDIKHALNRGDVFKNYINEALNNN